MNENERIVSSNPMKDRLGRRPSVLPVATGNPEKEAVKADQTQAVLQERPPMQEDYQVSVAFSKKQADPWRSVNIKMSTLEKYRSYAKKHGTTAQNLVTQVLDGWIEARSVKKK